MKIAFEKGACREARILHADGEGCTVSLGAAGGGISLPQVRESDKRYVIGDVEILEEHSVAMMFRCFVAEEEKERIFMRFGLLPGFKTRICLDLDLLDGRTIYTNRTPGCLKLVVHGHRTDRADVARFELGMEKCFHDVKVRFENFYLSDTMPEEFPIPDKRLVDEFGQWKGKEWPGKIDSLDALKEQLSKEEGSAEYPFPNWNRWGGDSTRKLKDGTGFFSTAKTADGRWHLTDPEGFEYFSLGPCGTHAGEWGRIDHFEKNCDWLPEDDPQYGEFFHRRDGRRAAYMPMDHAKMVNFTGITLKRIYGDEWERKWEEISCHVLMENGINSQGNFPGIGVNNGRGRIPYVRELMGFPMTETLIFRDFPDVFSEEYRENAAAYAKGLTDWKDDVWMIGYFLRNEPEFNFVEGLLIADEVLRNPAQTSCRMKMIEFLRGKYSGVEALNAAWQTGFGSFDDLKETIPDCSSLYPDSREDIRELSRMLLREYIRVPAQACRKVDPSKDMDFVKDAGVDLPILLGEYHCGALDRGLTATGLKGVRNQEERAVMWRYYVEHAAAHPYGVGAHWFQYNDQFCLGRYDGENYQIGMMDVCMRPHPELMAAARETSEVLYQVKNGEREPYCRKPEAIPMIGY